MFRHLVMLVLLLMAISAWAGPSDDDMLAQPSKDRVYQAQEAFNQLQALYPTLQAYRVGAMTTRLYGHAFAQGASPEATANEFIQDHAAVFGVAAADLVPGQPDKRAQITQPLMYLPETGQYKFTLAYFSQEVQGVPVFQSELRVLVRNEAGYPAVLAVSTLKDLDAFVPDLNLKGTYSALAEQAARANEPTLTDFSEQQLVIFAGDADHWQAPQMGVAFVGTSDFPERYLFVVNPYTGEIICKQNQIIFENVLGSVQGLATQGHGAEQCEEELPVDIKWARVNIGSTVAYTDERGDFEIPNSGSSPVTVESRL